MVKIFYTDTSGKIISKKWFIILLSPKQGHRSENTGERVVIWQLCKIKYFLGYGLLSFHVGGTKLERFLPKNQGNYWILRIDAVAGCQKVGIILVIKWFKNWCYQKMSITENVLLNWYSSMKRERERFELFLT